MSSTRFEGARHFMRDFLVLGGAFMVGADTGFGVEEVTTGGLLSTRLVCPTGLTGGRLGALLLSPLSKSTNAYFTTGAAGVLTRATCW